MAWRNWTVLGILLLQSQQCVMWGNYIVHNLMFQSDWQLYQSSQTARTAQLPGSTQRLDDQTNHLYPDMGRGSPYHDMGCHGVTPEPSGKSWPEEQRSDTLISLTTRRPWIIILDCGSNFLDLPIRRQSVVSYRPSSDLCCSPWLIQAFYCPILGACILGTPPRSLHFKSVRVCV